ncbi:hypothetical protein ACHHYP_04312 [Achlya hypogyna]|uniref:Globin domain-containing protein n=1 Tax=Achlya hypogyna TaxID=1202772 RepID=A0A1V9Z1E1_ACHHY|nr:hypothetical protein ACHHYP_04312 [Achlya hypogyna]
MGTRLSQPSRRQSVDTLQASSKRTDDTVHTKSISLSSAITRGLLHKTQAGTVVYAAAEGSMGDEDENDQTTWNSDFLHGLATPNEYQHYMPPNMPLFPVYDISYHSACWRSWTTICKGATRKMREFKKDGIVLFYDEFFHRLFQRDPSFAEIFPGIRKRIEVLIKAMKFMLPDERREPTEVRTRSRNLGYRHRSIPLLRPHHFATYTSTLVEVTMFWLDDQATPDIGEAWSNVIGFHLKYMLQAYLHENVCDSEWSQNVTIPVYPTRIRSSRAHRVRKEAPEPAVKHLPSSASSVSNGPKATGISMIMSSKSLNLSRFYKSEVESHNSTGRTANGEAKEPDWSVVFKRNLARPAEYQHYMPPNMPLCPTYEGSYHVECSRSWKILCKGTTDKMREFKKDGIVLFYDEFFHRLFQRDPSFAEIFPGIRKRIEVLIKAMKFMLPEKKHPNDVVKTRCRNLGYRHRTIPKIRPHHFSTYTSTMIEVIMYWLDNEATPDVGEAWGNLVGYHLKYLLQAYLFENVNYNEWSQNTTVSAGNPTTRSGFSFRFKSAFESKNRSANQSSTGTSPPKKTGEDSMDWSVQIARPLARPDEYQHYMPPNMPLCPQFEERFHAECNRSWKVICKGTSFKMREFKKDGIVLFYDEFFHRLFQRDPSFTDVFPGIRKRIETLIKAMKFMLGDAHRDTNLIITRCRNLGYRHKTIPLIRPHHFSTYTSTMIEVMMYWLDNEATPDVGEAWSNIVGFHLKYMLQAYLFENIDDEEWSQNTTITTARPRKTVEAIKRQKAAEAKARARKPFTTMSMLSRTGRTERESARESRRGESKRDVNGK